MSVIARWCFRHHFIVIGAWLLTLAVLGGTAVSAGAMFSDRYSLPGTESTRAADLLETQFQRSSGDRTTIVLHTTNGKVTDPAVQGKVNAMLAEVAKVPEVGAVVSPFSSRGAAQISPDRQTAYATITFTKQSQSLDTGNIQKVVDLGSDLRGDALEVEFGGAAMAQLEKPSTSTAELVGIVAAAIVMLFAFASVLATAIPLIAAILALGNALFCIDLLTHVMDIGTTAPIIAAFVGLGVGIDYALFVVARYRNGIISGLTAEEAAVEAMNTSGRAIVFAGGTVAVAMLGLLVLGISVLSGIGLAAAIMVAFAVAVAATLLPALFGIFGTRVLSRRQRARLKNEGPRGASASDAWARWAGFVQKRPVTLTLAATLVMVVLTVPFFSMRLGAADAGNNAPDTTTRKAYDLLAEGFGPGYNGPLLLVAKVPAGGAAEADLGRLEQNLRSVPGVASVQPGPVAPGATVRTLQVTPTTAPDTKETADLIDTLRDRVIPSYEKDGLVVHVGGQTAVFKDFASVVGGKMPLFVAIVVAFGCVLLMLAFRSLVIPLTAAVMNLLSTGAGFGVVVAVFQWGWGASALGAGSAGPVESFLPAMMLAVLFGLSMDYEVFLVSRIHEEWLHTGDNDLAVRRGQAATGRIITAAAIIMICVFMAFVFAGMRTIAEFGLGVAVAILLDALVVRTILVPAVMQLCGRWNWYLPKAIDKVLPHVSVEGPSKPAASRKPELQGVDGRT
ncbi:MULTISPECIES: MMPL family transporter [Actinomadura]|uniref:MMPL family transporter n=1 Tax=Actinomadura litoris TaxID=2678616 RepID=A0A7K1L252_9ACTN|nr:MULTISPECIES: MMPL family transporter [Actinomadura]MBT2208907.1 MMPL family transporter [Actinomadura sp. NEAU-AAG7]MUN38528.1 MMPL family transporter [Actinomadura litoris]